MQRRDATLMELQAIATIESNHSNQQLHSGTTLKYELIDHFPEKGPSLMYDRKIALVRQFDLTAQSMSFCLAGLNYHVRQLEERRDELTHFLNAHITDVSLNSDLPVEVELIFQRATHCIRLDAESKGEFELRVNRLGSALVSFNASHQRAEQQCRIIDKTLAKLKRCPAHLEDVQRRYPLLADLQEKLTAYNSFGYRTAQLHQEMEQHINEHQRANRLSRAQSWLSGNAVAVVTLATLAAAIFLYPW
jgi:hypothetical protein